MKFYTSGGSPNSRKVGAVIRHLGLPVATHMVDFTNGDRYRPDFLALNPNAMVPVLVDGDFRLWESNAIMQYLVAKAGGSPLFPEDPRVRADITRWQNWELAHFNKAFGTLVFEGLIKPQFGLGTASADLMAFCLAELARFAPVLERHLEDRRYLVGDAITLADYSMVCLERYRGKTAFDWSPFPAINRHFDAIRATDAWAGSDPAEAGAVQAA